jgi:hypothetical protein
MNSLYHATKNIEDRVADLEKTVEILEAKLNIALAFTTPAQDEDKALRPGVVLDKAGKPRLNGKLIKLTEAYL